MKRLWLNTPVVHLHDNKKLYPTSLFYDKIILLLSRTETMLMNNTTEKELVKKLREKYTKNPPEGMTAGMIKRMRDSDLLDMDYFLHEDVFGEDAEDGFFIF